MVDPSATIEISNPHPSTYVVPILNATPPSGPLKLAGTGFIAATAAGPRIVTAAHVLRGADPSLHWLAAVTRAPLVGEPQPKPELLRIRHLHMHSKLDVGWVEVDLPQPLITIPLAARGVSWESDIFCWDYSPGETTSYDDGRSQFHARAWAHKGNIVSEYEAGGCSYFNTSFPTMQGASGSPLLTRIGGVLSAVGMVVGNSEKEFSPSILAQQVTVRDGAEFFEDVKYFLPYGVSLSGTDLIRGVRAFFEPIVRGGDRWSA